MPIEKSAGAVLFVRENKKIKYLLLKHSLGHWDFPKGNIEKGEKIEDTVKREIKEETGISRIVFISDFKHWIKYFYRLKGKTVFKIVTFLLAEAKTKKVKLSFEHVGYKWLDFNKAMKLLKFRNSKEILKMANEFLNKRKKKSKNGDS
ncbi:NUDIX domain-containing protein [bacterium]|nr:NUDIX domain-containing protein [bacterium]